MHAFAHHVGLYESFHHPSAWSEYSLWRMHSAALAWEVPTCCPGHRFIAAHAAVVYYFLLLLLFWVNPEAVSSAFDTCDVPCTCDQLNP